jgi:hypothetical protein
MSPTPASSYDVISLNIAQSGPKGGLGRRATGEYNASLCHCINKQRRLRYCSGASGHATFAVYPSREHAGHTVHQLRACLSVPSIFYLPKVFDYTYLWQWSKKNEYLLAKFRPKFESLSRPLITIESRPDSSAIRSRYHDRKARQRSPGLHNSGF